MEALTITSGSIVLIASFDDVPEHQFFADEVFDDFITGTALTGPLTGLYGEPGLELVVCLVTGPD